MADGSLDDLYEQAGQAHNVDPALLKAVAKVESGERTFDNNGNVITSPAGAQGIMQFIPSTARRYGVNVADAGSSINGGAKYLSDLLNQTGGDVAHSLALYNGSGGDRNQTYAKKVLANYNPGNRTIVQTEGPPDDPALDKLFAKAPQPTSSAPAERPGQAPGTVAADENQQPATLDKLFTPQAPQADQPQGEQPSWFQRNVGLPARGIFRPDLPQPEGDNSFFGVPVLQSGLAGIMAGARSVTQGVVHAANWAGSQWDTNVLGVPVNPLGHQIEQQLERENEAWEAQHPDLFSHVAKFGGEMLAAQPFVAGVTGLLPEIPAVGGLGLLGRAVPRVANPALSGAAAGATQNVLTAQSEGQDPGNALLQGAVGGGALGGLTGGVGAALGAGVRGTRLQNIADDLRIRLSTGQRLGGVWQRIEDTMGPVPGSGARQFADQQRGDISALIDRELGGNGERNLTSDDLTAHETRITDDLDRYANRMTIGPPPTGSTFLGDLQNIVDAARIQGPQTSGLSAAAMQNQILSILRANGGYIPGQEFGRLIARGNIIDAAVRSSDPNVAQAGRQIREALMNAAEQSPLANPGDLAAFQRARYQYKVLRTVEPAIERRAGGTEDMNLGTLAQNIYSNPSTRRTEPLYQLMQLLGSTRGLASSGTAERTLWQKIALATVAGGGTAGGGVWALEHPHETERYATEYGPGALAALAATRGLRFGPGLGSNALQFAQRGFNPLLPRVGASWAGRQILGQPQQ